jgi:hypothetical protein
MKPIGRAFALALSIVLALSLAACTGSDGGGDGTTGGGTGGTGVSGVTGGDVGPTPVVSGSASSGTYEYDNAGLRVVVDIDGTSGTMEVDNGTDRELPPPGFYILDARDGTEIDGEVTDPTSIGAGDTASFDIAFSGIEVKEIGAIALLFGPDNYGLFVRTA